MDCAIGPRPCLAPSDSGGFAVDEAEVVFWGLCPDCLEQQQPAAGHHHETVGDRIDQAARNGG